MLHIPFTILRAFFRRLRREEERQRARARQERAQEQERAREERAQEQERAQERAREEEEELMSPQMQEKAAAKQQAFHDYDSSSGYLWGTSALRPSGYWQGICYHNDCSGCPACLCVVKDCGLNEWVEGRAKGMCWSHFAETRLPNRPIFPRLAALFYHTGRPPRVCQLPRCEEGAGPSWTGRVVNEGSAWLGEGNPCFSFDILERLSLCYRHYENRESPIHRGPGGDPREFQP